jgi:acetyl-CoA synthetase
VPESTITSMMEEKRIFYPPKGLSEKAYIKSMDEYKKIYQKSIADPAAFWGEMAGQLDWYKKWDKVLVEDFANAKHSWFVGGKINVSYNCIDRHVKTWRRNKAAIIWQGEPLGDTRTLTYGQLYYEVNKCANVLKNLGVKKGDRVCIYLPMIPELPISMLACARIGAVHTVVFGGFSAEALRDRIQDSQSKILICADGYYRSGKVIASKTGADTAMAACPDVKSCIVVKRTGNEVVMKEGRDIWWNDAMSAPGLKLECEPEQLDSEDTLFILYTSGSTGKPKGVMHTQAGYLLYCYQTTKWIFDIKDEDIHWCTADIGWITGHSYIVYGPLSVGATSLMFESVPTYPKPDRFWEIVEKYKVNIFYTAPTVIRSLMREGLDYINSHDLSSLRILGSVGEPINPEVWIWYYENIGKNRCPVVDTWWQTETGGILITPLPGAIPQKPGSATLPFPGIVPKILRADGSEASVNEGGYLVITKPWPGLMRRIWGDEINSPKLFKEKYFIQYPGVYTVGDGARKDEDGYYWLMGRIDDVIKVSGHRIGTAEVESALVSYPSVAEAAVVGMPHSIKGEGIYAYVTLKSGIKGTDELKKELVNHVRKVIGPIASPDKIQYTDALPKTRSGKIMRRLLVKIAAGDTSNLGDTSTLADPTVVDSLLAGRQ